MVELVVVLLVVAILAAAATPGILIYIESGRQTNRMDVARSLYLGAQNRLTELRVTRGLENAIPAGDTDGLVFNSLGINAEDWTDDDDNRALVHYIGKPAGAPVSAYPLVEMLLSSVVINKEMLDRDAILIEFNIETGVVMSVFYSDRFESGRGFGYLDENSEYNIRPLPGRPEPGVGVRGMGEAGYEPTARGSDRRQGYYGVEKTGELANRGFPIVTLHDGANTPINLPGDDPVGPYAPYAGSSNTLYTTILVPSDVVGDADDFDPAEELDIRINGDPLTEDVLSAMTFIEGTDSGAADYVAYHLILDHLRRSGNKAPDEDIEVLLRDMPGIGVDSSISVNVRLRNGTQATSNEWHPYFDGAADLSDTYGILSGRHLHNIRHAPERNFTLRRDIDFEAPGSVVDQFTPIANVGGDSGIFRGHFNGNRRVISNLTVNSEGNAGLFTHIDTGSSVVNLTIENPDVRSRSANAGAVSGRNEGTINVTFIKYSTDSSLDLGFGMGMRPRRIDGALYTGGITGWNEGTISGATFISPLPEEHIHVATSSSAGGIAGRNTPQTGSRVPRIDDALFLALAPKDGDNIVPISSDGEASNVYFLSGAPVHPSLFDIEDRLTVGRRSGFNLERVSGIGEGDESIRLDTWTFYDQLNKPLPPDGEGYELPSWTRLLRLNGRPLTEEQIHPEYVPDEPGFRHIYPYPFLPIWNSNDPELRIIPDNPGVWPIVAKRAMLGLFAQNLAYYEADTAVGTVDSIRMYFSHEDEFTGDETLPLINDGYVFNFEHAHELKITVGDGVTDREYVLTDRSGDSVNPDWLLSATVAAEMDLWSTQTPVSSTWEIDGETGETIDGYQLFLDNTVLEELSDGRFISFIVQIGDIVTYAARFNPMFANTVITADAETAAGTDFTTATESSLGTDEIPFNVRSPRHLSNVGTAYEASFAQGLDLDFEIYRKELSIVGPFGAVAFDAESRLEFPDSAVVTGTFRGRYDGSELEIRNLTARVGVFADIGRNGAESAVVENVNLYNVSITANTGLGVGALAGTSSGNILSVNVRDSSVAASGINNLSVGGVVGVNYNLIENTIVTGADINTTSGVGVGGVAGTNNGAIRNASLNGTSRITSNGNGTFRAGGITAVNNSLIMDATVTESVISVPNGAAGGITGTNNGSSFISTANVSGSTVSVARTGVAGGIAGNNVAGIQITGMPELNTGGRISGYSVENTDISAPAGTEGFIAGSNGGNIAPTP